MTTLTTQSKIRELELSLADQTILVVDDNRNNLDILSEILSAQGYTVRRAINGSIALQSVAQLKPALILLDINMPGLNGYEVCQRLKSSNESQNIPVIFISALNESIDKAMAFSVGGVDYIEKPFEIVEVLARVKNQLSLHAAKEDLRNALDQQLQQRARELMAEAERSHALAQVVDKIRRTLELSTIFNTATEEIRNILKVDRTTIIQLHSSQLKDGGIVIAESKSSQFSSILREEISGASLNAYYQAGIKESQEMSISRNNQISVIQNAHQRLLTSGYNQNIENLKLSSSIIIPIIKNNNLWGLFCISQSSETTQWLSEDIDFAHQVCIQLGVAVQQAKLLSQAQVRATELSRTLADLNAIVDNLADGLLVTDINGVVTQLNPALLSMLNIDAAQLINRKLDSYFPSELTSLVREVCQSKKSTGYLEVQLGEEHQGKAIVSPILKKSVSPGVRRIQGCVILIRDITREKEVDRMKTDFLSTVSHELRTPLTSILGFASIIDSRLTSRISPAVSRSDQKAQKALQKTHKNLNIIVSEAERLTNLINQVLDIAKMEEGKVTWDFQEIDPTQILRQAMETTVPLFKDKPVELISEFPSSLTPLRLDKDKIHQVMINLISNAIKFTDKGFVKCCGSISNGKLLIRVIDSGIGLSSAQKERVFDKFIQLGDILTSKPQGSGLGLSICKQIIDAHNGKIWVESQAEQGSIFSISIPLESSGNQILASTSSNIL